MRGAHIYIDHQMLAGAYRLSNVSDVHGCHVFMSKVEGGPVFTDFYLYLFFE